jgi:serine/threonine-protein kinase
MLTTDLGACEWFVWDLRRSNLIDRVKLDEIIGEFLSNNPGAEPPALALHLVTRGVLTDFQAERLLQGKTQGFVLGPFTLTDALGTGSMGTVYKAQSKTDNQFYAVKVLPRRSMWNVRIARRKVRLFEQCRHASVVPFIDVGTAGGMHYLAWPLVEGTSLDKVVATHGALAPDVASLYVSQAAEGLAQCHLQKLVHGLLKPSNLMLGCDGQVFILDFGIGCLLAETEGESLVDTMSTANSVNSGLDCSSPESIMDPTNLTSLGDQYSLGCVLYFLLAGRYPFPDGTAVEKMMAHQHKQPTPIKQLVPALPDGLAAVVEKLMEKAPADRFPSCAELVEALRPFASAAPARRYSHPARTLRPAEGSSQTGEPRAGTPIPPAVPGAGGGAPRAAARLSRINQPLPPRPPSRDAGARQAPQAQPARAANPKAGPPPIPAPTPRPGVALPRPQPTPPPIPGPEPRTAAAVEQPDANPDAPASLGQRLGTFGVILVAIAAGALAWLLSSLVPFKF